MLDSQQYTSAELEAAFQLVITLVAQTRASGAPGGGGTAGSGTPPGV